MKQTIEKIKIPPPEKIAETIRRKINQKIPLSPREEAFLREQQKENRRDDNPYQR